MRKLQIAFAEFYISKKYFFTKCVWAGPTISKEIKVNWKKSQKRQMFGRFLRRFVSQPTGSLSQVKSGLGPT